MEEGEKVKCPKCESKYNHVIDTRPSGDLIRRRRECEKCGKTFSTIEVSISRYKEETRLAKMAAAFVKSAVEYE